MQNRRQNQYKPHFKDVPAVIKLGNYYSLSALWPWLTQWGWIQNPNSDILYPMTILQYCHTDGHSTRCLFYTAKPSYGITDHSNILAKLAIVKGWTLLWVISQYCILCHISHWWWHNYKIKSWISVQSVIFILWIMHSQIKIQTNHPPPLQADMNSKKLMAFQWHQLQRIKL